MLVTFTDKWQARNKFKVDPATIVLGRPSARPASTPKMVTTTTPAGEPDDFRAIQKDLSLVMKVLDRHPAALTEVRNALRERYGCYDPDSPLAAP